LADRQKVADYLRRFPPEVSEHTFTNLYVWRYHRPIRAVERDGTLIFVELRSGERRVLGPPCGEEDPSVFLGFLQEAGVRSLHRLPESAAESLRQAGLRVEPDPDNADYVYLREDLAELAGRRYHRKKNMVNRCLAAYQCEYCEIEEGLIGEVTDMIDRWFAERELGQSLGLAEEYWAIRETLDRFTEFGLIGGAARIAGQIEAIAIGEALNEDTAVVHFEKAMTGYAGLYQLVNQWFCKHGLAEFEFVNREQDLGVPGLRKAKESYLPHHMVGKYSAWLDGASAHGT
ncbi:MAG: DUF2156 domain-containing protein, partial [Planctomycetota bacterium]|jgi:hypothetical protein